jgi:hypothetical protein
VTTSEAIRFSDAIDSIRNRESGGSSFSSRLPVGFSVGLELVFPV